MNRTIQFVLFLMPVIGMLSGLSLSVTTSIFLLLMLIAHHPKPVFEMPAISTIAVITMLWFLITCFLSPKPLYSFCSYIGFAVPLFATLYLMPMDKQSREELVKISSSPLFFGLLVAIILFFIEYYSDGFFSTTFRLLVQKKQEVFVLFWLDRGSVFISILIWIVIGNLITRKQKLAALGVYICTIYLLYLSDSLAAFVGAIFAGCAYILLHITKMRLGTLMRICFAAYIIAMPILSYKQNPLELSNNHSLPDSAKHRLFIWNFVAHKATDNIITGSGFASSRFIATDDDVVDYGQYKWCLLPLHPHNNVMQIFLETGLIGLMLLMLMVDQILKWIIQNKSPLAAACFINYFIVGMISFSIWQSWWVGVGLFALLMIKAQEEK